MTKLTPVQLHYLKVCADSGLINTNKTTRVLYEKGLLKYMGFNPLFGACYTISDKGLEVLSEYSKKESKD